MANTIYHFFNTQTSGIFTSRIYEWIDAIRASSGQESTILELHDADGYSKLRLRYTLKKDLNKEEYKAIITNQEMCRNELQGVMPFFPDIFVDMSFLYKDWWQPLAFCNADKIDEDDEPGKKGGYRLDLICSRVIYDSSSKSGLFSPPSNQHNLNIGKICHYICVKALMSQSSGFYLTAVEGKQNYYKSLGYELDTGPSSNDEMMLKNFPLLESKAMLQINSLGMNTQQLQ